MGFSVSSNGFMYKTISDLSDFVLIVLYIAQNAIVLTEQSTVLPMIRMMNRFCKIVLDNVFGVLCKGFEAG